MIFLPDHLISGEVKHLFKLLSTEEGVGVEEMITSDRSREVLHLPHGCNGIPRLPLPDEAGHSVHSKIIEHSIVSSWEVNNGGK